MQYLKKILRTKHKLLQQVVKRLSEYETHLTKTPKNCNDIIFITKKKIKYKNFTIGTDKGNNCFIDKGNNVIIINKLELDLESKKVLNVHYQKFNNACGIKDYPIDSKKLSMYKLYKQNLCRSLKGKLDIISQKCVLIPSNSSHSKFICVPFTERII